MFCKEVKFLQEQTLLKKGAKKPFQVNVIG
jgi:hypothetical protein